MGEKRNTTLLSKVPENFQYVEATMSSQRLGEFPPGVTKGRFGENMDSGFGGSEKMTSHKVGKS